MSDGILRAIGRITVNFNMLEVSVASSVWVLLGVDWETCRRVTNALAFRPRVDLLESLADLKLQQEPLRNHVLKMVPKLRNLEDRRNQILHSVWSFSGNPEVSIRIKLNARGGRFVPPKHEPLTAEGLDTFADELTKITARIGLLAVDIQDQLGRGTL